MELGTSRTEGDQAGVPVTDLVRGIGSLALVAAGAIHLAYAPAHLDEKFSHGLFFLVVGWSQLTLAAGLALRARPRRAWLGAAALSSLAVMGVWLLSRTVGTPGSDTEPVGFADATATGLEAVVVLVALALIFERVPARAIPRGPGRGVAVAAAAASVVLASVSISPSVADEHQHGSADDAHAAGAATDPAWAETRLAALEGYMSADEVAEFKQLAWDDLADDIRTHSEALRDLPESEREARIEAYLDWVIDNTLAVSGETRASATGDGVMHSHGLTEWQPVSDPGDQATLRDQLRKSATPIERFPTVADAEAAGYYQITPYVPGIAAHYTTGAFDTGFDPTAPEMLLYNGTDPTSEIVGVTYVVLGTNDRAPDGFASANDVWHRHEALCVFEGFVVGVDGTPRELCEGIGAHIEARFELWMLHLWQVPGWESPWGLFSAENPSVSTASSDMWANRPRS